jgi:hypothetical protein
MVIPPARTGIDNNRRTAVRPIAQTINLTLSAGSFPLLRHKGLAIKLIDAISLLTTLSPALYALIEGTSRLIG